ncbi:XRE family transcriptional regulator [Methylobacterium sp. E-005]|uniref:XRE family transcriptional regulator n=1 Tax=Methylobacterium sp. E-005 TaxID=2836549 RepID=UPI001FBA9B5A|nr:XRE family transcriptional regulator [Methylobacterium sp. E-005]MCJ2089754.1 XRE family transcriptional regulator [Methylobacterium sp. E-005]
MARSAAAAQALLRMKQVEQFNRYMMMLARDSRGLTQSSLADQMNVAQGTISKAEAGMSEPPNEFVSELARVLKYTPEFFYETGRPYGMPPFHYRRRKKLGQKPLDRMIAEMNIRRIHLRILLRSYDARANGFIPEIDRNEYQGFVSRPFSVEDAARHLREQWMLPDGPIDNVTDLLEENGGVVIPCNFDNDLIDAVSQRIDGTPVLFFVNMNAPADRIRHTLCHELAHMVLHTTTLLDDDVMEDEADIFAGSFLLPAKSIKAHLSRFDIRQIANLKRHWKVSMSSIAMRADRLHMITPYQKKAFFIEMSKLGYRKAEPHEPKKEYPKKLVKLIDYHTSVLGYSNAELAKALFISASEFDRMYGNDMLGPKEGREQKRPTLRLIQ